MAPRTARAKKTSNTKPAENEAPKKGKGKAKTVEEPEINAVETAVGDEAPIIEKKSKRGKKAEGDTNGLEEINGADGPPLKKGRKNKVADSASAQKEASNDDNAAEDESSTPKEDIEEQEESNDHSEEVPATAGKGRKKATKKESAASKTKTDSKTSNRGKKNVKLETESEVTEKDEAIEEKPKTAGKGRTRKAPQKVEKETEPEENNESGEEEVKAEPPPAKGRKRGPTKSAKETTPESEQDVQDLNEDESAEEPKKKEIKGKKNQGKKATVKQAEVEEEKEEEKQEPATKKRKVTKKDGKDEVKDGDELTEETAAESKPAKGKRGQKKVAVGETEEAQDTGDTTNKRRRKAADEKVSEEETKKKAPPKNKATTNYEEIDFSNTSKNGQGKEWNLKIASWNVDGIRAWMSKGGLDYIKYEKPDILCLQETKCAKDKLPDEIANLPGYHAYWQGSDKDGYAGVGIYTTKLAMNVQYGLQNEELDSEGRMITAEYEQFYLICTYVPNAGRKLVTLPKRLQWNEEFRKYVKALNEKKPVIICGDMNVAHNEIDLSNPKSNKKNAGFTEEERAGMTDLLSDGFVDIYRHLKPDQSGAYTFWTYMMNSRAKNVGWRLDYFLMSERLLPSLCDTAIRSEVYGSDHCPITLYLHITSADKPKE